jgi:hypothetical protein
MAKARIHAGICGFTTEVTAEQNGDMKVRLAVESSCPHITEIFAQLQEVEPFTEIGFFGGRVPAVLQAQQNSCPHAACPVFSGVIKAVEVAAGLALPADVSITLEK